jgi:uncharacterized membrane protein
MNWRSPFNAFLTVPAGISCAIGATALLLVGAERVLGTPHWLLSITDEVGRALVTVVAGAAITTLTLTYSLTLVVFTLAASSIGPRLLKRFTSDRVNHVTAGLLGGTFIYALVTLGFSGPHPPRVAVVGAGLLAVVCVIQLIWFVRSVAKSVSIDDEIASIVARLGKEIARLKSNLVEFSLPAEDQYKSTIRAGSEGYVARIDRTKLCTIAEDCRTIIRVECQAGDYVLADSLLLSVTGNLDKAQTKLLEQTVHLEPSRSDSGTVAFSINLLVEIALRALSPGVNDTFTALAVSDMLSGALSHIAKDEPQPELIVGQSGDLRLILPGISLKQLFGQAFHPLRRASVGNILMAQGLARAYSNLFDIGGAETKKIMRQHAKLLLDGIAQQDHLKADVESILEILRFMPDERWVEAGAVESKS